MNPTTQGVSHAEVVTLSEPMLSRPLESDRHGISRTYPYRVETPVTRSPLHTLPLLVGIGHRARQGKDTLASLIHACAPAETTIMRLADPLKMYARMTGLMNGKDSGLLQKLGLLFRQHCHEDFFIQQLEYRIQDEPAKIILLSDLRYRNELAWIRQHQGIAIRVHRLTPDGAPYFAADRDPDHVSECELDDATFDYEITARTGDLSALTEAANRLWCDVIAPRAKGQPWNSV
jgi:hypothetical protein